MKIIESIRFNLLRVYLTVLILCLVPMSFAQEKQKIPVDFFKGKWAGDLKGYYWDKETGTITFAIEYQGTQHAGDAVLLPYGLPGGGMIFVGSKGRPFTVEEGKKPFYENVFGMIFTFDVGENPNLAALGLASLFASELLDSRVDLDSSVIKVNHYRGDSKEWIFEVHGDIYKLNNKKLIYLKDIGPNELIKTDEKTQIEIILPNESEVKVAQDTEAVFKSESFLEVVKGKLHDLIKNLKPKSKFEIYTPTSIVGVRGTEYAIEVENDGTTVVRVFDDEVEFSDKENKRIVIVKKNQQSTTKPGGLPSDPIQLNPSQFLRWWK